MAFFVLNSRITLGKYRLVGVNNVLIRRSIHQLGDTATIKIPRDAKVQKGTVQADGSIKIVAGTAVKKFPAKLFTDGAAVVIELGYNGDLKEEFRGFVKRRSLTMPLEVECEGYIRQLRVNVNLNGFLKLTSVKEMLELAAGIKEIKSNKVVKVAQPKTDITIVCQSDIPMHNMQFNHANGLQVAEEIKKVTQGTLAVYFINPTVLWCGFTYTPYVNGTDPFGIGEVNYRLGFNCIKDNGLKERVVDEPVQVIFGGTYATGKVVETKSEAGYAVKKEKTVFNNIQDEGWMKKMANEKQYHMNYAGYMGHITGFLQPFCVPGFRANITERDYEERNGSYMVESTEVTFGVRGARRVCELGPIIGFDPKNIVAA